MPVCRSRQPRTWLVPCHLILIGLCAFVPPLCFAEMLDTVHKLVMTSLLAFAPANAQLPLVSR